MFGTRGARPTFVLLFVALVLLRPDESRAQSPRQFSNGSLESWSDDGSPEAWLMPPTMKRSGYRLSKESDQVYAGSAAALVDSTSVDATASMFGNLVQSIDATPFRGKRIRYRAAVRTGELDSEGRAQLWLRVDRESVGGQRRVGAFDNMQNRPIRTPDWKHFEIVVDVDDDAQSISLGMFIKGKGKAWIDDVSLEVIEDEDAKVTTMTIPDRAVRGGAQSQSQPFFTAWLLLPLIALTLFGLSYRPTIDNRLDWLYRFAFRFTFAYWLLYSLPSPIGSVIPYYGYRLTAYFKGLEDQVVRWAAPNLLGIERELIAPNGSGDTTFAYVRVFLCFGIALAVAAIWSLADRRRSDYSWLKDLLRSYLRYVLAFTMLGYGLAKLGGMMNQFPEPEVNRLMQPYGDSSPMGLLWTFMGASRPYTYFAGLGEVLGGALLLWRRTTTLGALVVVGVMANVVMLNFCYDVPVKQYSSHLLCMALILLLPDAGRLANLLAWNRATEPTQFTPPYTNSSTIWVQRGIKTAIILIGFAWPVGMKIYREAKASDARVASVQPEVFGYYDVEQFERDGEPVPPLATDATRWKSAAFVRYPRPGSRSPDYASVTMMNDRVVRGECRYSPQSGVISVVSLGAALKTKVIDDDRIELKGLIARQPVTIQLRRIRREDFLLVNRGFHWISEYPYNR